jgi:glycosyltransferase involved in cell wall biosynthesis
MNDNLNIIEPTLASEAGHCFSFISSLAHAADSTQLTLWCDHSADVNISGNILTKRYFFRKIRKLQAFWLYRKLLGTAERIFISTAGRTDLILLDLASSGRISANRVFVYMHWFKPSQRKRKQLEKLARRQPEIVVFAPTKSVGDEFENAGFKHVRLVPYPITPLASGALSAQPRDFSHVLFAGAARQDKGFGNVVDFVELLASTGRDIPVRLQTSAQHYDKMDEVASAGLSRLEHFRYPHLKRYAETLQHSDYVALFDGAICLQLYSQKDFADRISGVTLDALSMGSPIVTLAETWIARVVSEFDAGLVLESPDPDAVLGAVTRIISDYGHYRSRALEAGRELQKRNSAEFLLRELMA